MVPAFGLKVEEITLSPGSRSIDALQLKDA